MKHSLIVLAVLAGTYTYSNNANDAASVKTDASVQQTAAAGENQLPKQWKLYSFNQDKSCLLDTADIDKQQSFTLPTGCKGLISGLSGSARLVATTDGYDLLGTDNAPIVRFGTGEFEGFESYFPDHVHLRIEPASES